MNHLIRLLLTSGLFAFVLIIVGIGVARHDATLLAPAHLIFFAAGMALYLLPTAVALHRNCKATAWLAAVNVLLGWTVFGWFVSMAWAALCRTSALPSAVTTSRSQVLSGH